MAKTLAQKLQIKPGSKVLFVNPPPGYGNLLGKLSENLTFLSEPGVRADVIQVFVRDQKDLEEQLNKLKGALQPRGILWVSYYKGTSQHRTDINRDTINVYARSMGMEGVAIISVNEDWSAMRLKVVDH
jgi:hypothetical protein